MTTYLDAMVLDMTLLKHSSYAHFFLSELLPTF